MEKSTNIIAFQRITESRLRTIPYIIQQVTPSKNKPVKITLISRALLSLNIRVSCGIILHAINAPATKPKYSAENKSALPYKSRT